MKKSLIACICLSMFIFNNVYAQWEYTSSNLPSDTLYVISSNGSNIFLSTPQGLYSTTDNGSSWISRNQGLITSKDQIVVSIAANATTIFAGTNKKGIFLSTDNGITWMAKNTGLVSSANISAIALSGNNVIAASISTSDLGEINLSTDNGNKWTIKEPFTAYIPAIAGDGTNVFAGDVERGLLQSTDNGNTWERNSKFQGRPLSIAINGNNIFVGESGNVHLSTDIGKSWTKAKIGTGNSSVHSIVISGSRIFAGTSAEGVFLSTDNGTTWTAINSGLTNLNIVSLAISGNNIFVATRYGGVFKSKVDAFGANTVEENDLAVNSLVVSPNPTSDYLEIFSTGSTNPEFVNIYNTLGMCVLSVEQTQLSTQRIDVSHLPASAYYLKIGGTVRSFVKF
ncbi:MAG: T9SS type A sorting domain-containing protein [Ignavibacteria bacterium]|nr:T9SS type A sorting domain-containing protein [Ignavibacteria bacterium]